MVALTRNKETSKEEGTSGVETSEVSVEQIFRTSARRGECGELLHYESDKIRAGGLLLWKTKAVQKKRDAGNLGSPEGVIDQYDETG